jgi:hypothetical protein
MLRCVGNVTLPTPVFVAGGALCLLGGYLAGAVLGQSGAERPTATVVSYDARSSELCLEGESVQDEKGVDEDGRLCGTWSRSAHLPRPREGDTFRFIAIDRQLDARNDQSGVVILGTVVEK